MKVKKTTKKSEPLSDDLVLLKYWRGNVDQRSVSKLLKKDCIQLNDSVVNQSDTVLPQILKIPIFNTSKTKENVSESALPPMSSLKRLPLFTCDTNENISINHTIDESINESINESFNETINESINENIKETVIKDKSSLDQIITEESINELEEDLGIEKLTNEKTKECNIFMNKKNNSLNERSVATITPLTINYESNDSITLNTKRTTIAINITKSSDKPISSSNTFVNKVNIDLSDDTNSPKNSINEFIPKETTTNFQTFNFGVNHNCPQSNAQSFESQIKKKSQPKNSMKTQPLKYCARNYRLIGVSRHSSRLKNNTNDNLDDIQYENAKWSEIDGSEYMCTVSKWKEDNDMNEGKRKDILSKVRQMKFSKSVYKDDEGVFYSYSAFKSECNAKDGLKCMMRLDCNSVKHMRFSGDVITRLFLLSGQSLLNAEMGKQRKNIETGHELVIPQHTRYQLENNNVESCYFFVHMFKPSIH